MSGMSCSCADLVWEKYCIWDKCCHKIDNQTLSENWISDLIYRRCIICFLKQIHSILQYVLNTRAHHSTTYEWKPDFVCVILVFGFHHPNKTAIFLVDWCGRLANDHCPHYLCWISSPCDYRSYMVFSFLIVRFCRVKSQLNGDIFKISSLKDFALRSIILPAFL
jgi:hypothetical protein